MPVSDLQSFKVTSNEASSSTKFDNFVQAVQDEFGDIDADQVNGLHVFVNSQVVSGASTDLAWGAGSGIQVNLNVTTGGGTLRSLGAPTAGAGTRVSIVNASGTNFTVLNNPGGGSGVAFANDQNFDVVVAGNGGYVQYVYDGSFWRQIGFPASSFSTWTAYTPPWTASITNPVLGNGGSVGSYTRIGKTVHFRILITMGTTTTYGSGWYQLWCPITPAAGATSFAIGNGYLYDASAAVQYPLMGKLEGSGIISLWNTDVSNALVTASTPFTFATSDIITLSGTYEAA